MNLFLKQNNYKNIPEQKNKIKILLNEFFSKITDITKVNKLKTMRTYWALLYDPPKQIWPIDLSTTGVVLINGAVISIVVALKKIIKKIDFNLTK